MPKENKEKISKTVKKQKTMLDQLWLALLYGAKNAINNESFIIAQEDRLKYGFNEKTSMTEEDKMTSEECLEPLKLSLVKNYTMENIRNYYITYGTALAYVDFNAGKELKAVMDSLPDEKDANGDRLSDDENDRIKEMKASYLAFFGQVFSANMAQSIPGINLTMNDFIENDGPDHIDSYGEYPLGKFSDLAWNDLNFTKEMTFAELFERQGFTEPYKSNWLKRFNVDENTSVFEAYKNYHDELNSKRSENNRINVNDNYIIKDIQREYPGILQDMWLHQGVSNLVNSLSAVEKIQYEKGKNLKDYKQPKEIDQWVKKEGKDLAYKMSGPNLVNNYNNVLKSLHSEKPLGMMKNSLISDAYNDKLPKDYTYVRMVIKKLVDTKQGSGTWHKSNSDSYEKMLASIKAYNEALEEKAGGRAMEIKKEMLARCKAYISGKEKVRKSPFGVTRFDAVMALLYKELPEDEFNTIMNRVNRKRGFTSGTDEEKNNDDYVSKDSLNEYIDEETNKFITSENNRINEMQEATKENRLDIPDRCIESIKAVDDIYGRVPVRPAGYNQDKFSDEDMAKLKAINEEFTAIGRCQEDAKLSEKDFVAIAFAGALTPEAVRSGGKVVNQLSPENNLKMTGEKYSINLFSNDKSFNIGLYAGAIEYGRENAVNSMNAYANGDKTLLAKTLTSGIKYLVETAKQYSETNDQLIGVTEMAKRMSDMLLRDKEILKLAKRDGLTTDELNFVKAMSNMSELHNKSIDGQGQIDRSAKENAWTENLENSESRVDYITKIVIKDMLKASIKKCEDERSLNTDYTKVIEQCSENIKDNYKLLGDMREMVYSEKAERIIFDKIDRQNFYMTQAGAKYRVHNPMYDLISNDAEYSKLNSTVKAMVKKAGLHNLNPTDLKKQFDSGRIFKKISAFTEMKPKAEVKKQKQEIKVKMNEPKQKVKK